MADEKPAEFDATGATLGGGGPFRASHPRGTSIGRYTILTAIGTGGVGTVYAAYDPELDRKVAIKIMRPETFDKLEASEARGRMQREAQAMARLAHPNVVSVYDVGTFGDDVFVAMELIEGVTVKHWWHDEKRTWRDILDVFRQAARGLSAAHAAGLVHRDFKPENVLVGNDGRVRVLDFGLARAASAEPSPPQDTSRISRELADTAMGVGSPLSATLTRTGTLLGTPAYMSPEQHLRHHTDERSDQFSFCVSLYEALYGVRPFLGETLAGLSIAIMSGNISEPPKGTVVPSWLRAHVVKGLNVDPTKRFASIDELDAALARDPAIRRRRIAIAAAITAGFVVAGLVGYKLSTRQQAPRARETGKPINLDFERGHVGDVPDGWTAAGDPKAYQVTLVDQGCVHGARCAMSRYVAAPTNGAEFGTVMQQVDARPWHGKKVRFRASVRTEESGAAFLWIRVDRARGETGFFYNSMEREPLRGATWQSAEIVGEVADDAATLNYGVIHTGQGRVFVDAVSVEEVPDSTPVSDVPLQATPVGLDFEDSSVGAAPTGWRWIWSPDHEPRISDDHPSSGTHCLEVTGLSTVFQRIDATPWRGKQLEITAAARSSEDEPPSVIVAVEDGSTNATQFFDKHQIPVAPTTWAVRSIELTVPATAKSLTVQVFPAPKGKAWIDEVAIRVK